jgi:hypothetical protein
VPSPRVQSKSFSVTAAQSGSGAFTSSVGNGNTLLIAIGAYYGPAFSETPFSVTDSQGNTYTLLSSIDLGNGLYLYSADNVVGGAVTVTVSAAVAGAFYFNVVAIEYSGLASAAFDAQATNSATSNPFSVGPITTTVAAEVLIGLNGRLDTSNDYTPDSPWTTLAYNGANGFNGLQVSEQITSATGSYSYTGTGAGGRALIAGFKGAGGGPTPISSSDTGAGTDAATLVVSISAADTGAGADASSLAASLSSPDSAAGTEGTPAILAGLIQADTAAGAEASTLIAALSGGDSGTGTDSGSVFSGLTVSDSDSGVGTDGVSSLAATVATSDAGTGTDASTLAATLAASDAGTGADSGSVFAGLTVSDSDSGHGTEGTPVILAGLAGSDSAVGTDAAASLSVVIAAADAGHGADFGFVVGSGGGGVSIRPDPARSQGTRQGPDPARSQGTRRGPDPARSHGS